MRIARVGVGSVGALLAVLVLGATSAHAVRPTIVFVKAHTSFEIDPSLGFSQYFGTIRYGKVSVVLPPNGKLNKKIIKRARKACLDLFVNGDGVTYPAFIIYDELNAPPEVGIRRLSVQSSPFSIDASGNWTSKGFSSNDPTKIVRAQGGFWDSLYNFKSIERFASFKVGAKKISAECDANVSVEAEYPG